MTVDALDPGPDWTWPNVPRDRDGFLDEQLMPVGQRVIDVHGRQVVIDVTPTVRARDGALVSLTNVVPCRPPVDP